MTTVQLADVLRLERRSLTLDPLTEYTLIGVYSFGKGIFHREPLIGADLGGYRFFEIHPGDLVLSNIQAWEGAIAVAAEHDRGSIGTHRFLTYVPSDDRVDASYLRYYFLSSAGSPQIQRASPGSVTRNRTLATDRFKDIEISLPPVASQRQIAARLDTTLSTVADAQASIRRSLQIADALRWAELREAFARLTEREPTALLSDAVDLNPESANPAQEGGETFRYVDIGSIQNGTGRIVWPKEIALADTPSRARRRIRAGDVLVSTVRPTLRGTAVVPPELDGAVASTGLAVLRPRAPISPEFLALQCLSDIVIDQLIGESRGGHYPAVNDSRLRNIRVVIPPASVQEAVVNQVKPIMAQLGRVIALRKAGAIRLQALEMSVLNAAFQQRP